MNKSYYITQSKDLEDISIQTLTGFGHYLYGPGKMISRTYYVVEDIEENRERIVVEILKGNIDPSMKFDLDLDRFNTKDDAYNIKERRYYSQSIKFRNRYGNLI
jgi:hypothetical protein